MHSDEELLAHFKFRRTSLEKYLKQSGKKIVCCPGCGYPSLTRRGEFQICALCDWEDDGQDDGTADEVWGGPNGVLSLTASRLKFEMALETLCSQTQRELETSPDKVVKVVSAIRNELKRLYDLIPDEAEASDAGWSNAAAYRKQALHLLLA